MKDMFLWILDNWRDRVVPLLWAAFAAGILFSVSMKVDDMVDLYSGRSGMDMASRAALRADITALAPNRLPVLEGWLIDQPLSSSEDEKALASSVIKYLRYDQGFTAMLGDELPLRIKAWGEVTLHRLGAIHPLWILTFFMFLWSALFVGYRKRIWCSLCYFTSRVMLFTAYGLVWVGFISALGGLWLMGSSAARLTSLPALLPLWVVFLASGKVISQIILILVVACLGSMMEAVFPDP